MTRILFLLLAFFVGFGSPLSARPLTLDEARRMARDNYPLIRRYGLLDLTRQIALSRIDKGWLPQLTLSGQATLQSDVPSLPSSLKQVMSRMGRDVRGMARDQYRLALDLDQKLYDGGAMAADKVVAEADNAVERAENAVNLYAVRSRVDDLFFGVLLVGEKLRLNAARQTRLQAAEDRLSAMVSGGTAMECDRAMVRAERLAAVQEEAALLTQRASLLELLGAYVGRSVTEVVRPEPVTPEAASSVQEQVFDTQLRLIRAQERRLNASLRPRVSLFSQAYYGYPGLNMYDDMFSRSWSLNALVGVRMAWNVSAFYTRKDNLRHLDRQRDLIELSRETFRFNNRLRLTAQQGQIDQWRAMLRHDDEIVSLRAEVRQAAEAQLAHGVVDAATLVREISNEHQACINRSLHELEMLKAEYELQNIQGE